MNVARVVNSFLQSNTFVLFNDEENEVCLVDIGDFDSVLKILDGRIIGTLLLTHAHYDHVYGINKLLTRYPDCKIFASLHTLDALKNDKQNFSYYYEKPLSYIGGDETVIDDGDRIMLWGNTCITSLLTPGHTSGSTCYLTTEDIFTGDSFIPNIATLTKLKGGNKSLAEESMKTITNTIKEGMRVHPGHLCQYIKNNNKLQPIG